MALCGPCIHIASVPGATGAKHIRVHERRIEHYFYQHIRLDQWRLYNHNNHQHLRLNQWRLDHHNLHYNFYQHEWFDKRWLMHDVNPADLSAYTG